MTYILVIWTVITCTPYYCKYDWRPIGEFHASSGANPQALCEDAARQMSLKTNEWRCVRSK